MACGFEAELSPTSPTPGEGVGGILIGKMQWLSRAASYEDSDLRNLVCMRTVRLGHDVWSGFSTFDDLRHGNGATANARLQRDVHPECNIVSRSALVDPLSPPESAEFDVTFTVNGICMRAQVNATVANLVYSAQVGTDGLPCLTDAAIALLTPPIIPHDLSFTKRGDGDVAIREMTRVYFLNAKLLLNRTAILAPVNATYLRDKLLTLHGRPGPASYPILGCGNTEQSSGTPQDLADEESWLDEAWNDLGDAFDWFARRAIVFSVLGGPAAVAALIGAGAAVPGAAVAAAIAGVGALGINELNIPETENHRLMIESSRFLKNEIIVAAVPKHPQIQAIKDDRDESKAWILDYLAEVMKRDFSEYNARPYQRYSIMSLYNLADFAEDADVKSGASMVIEFSLAKFALSSREGIRVAPYRRLVEAMHYSSNIDFVNAGDHAAALMLLYAGQLQRFPSIPPTLTSPGGRWLSIGGPSYMIYAATSDFRPASDIVDLAIDKSMAYFQRVKNGGVEIYSSTRSFTIAAGGVVTPPYGTLQFGELKTPFRHAADFGTGLPTSFIPSGTSDFDRLSFMRFEGIRENHGSTPAELDKNGWTYDHNTCVWHGFACGVNFKDADNLRGCFQPGLDGARAEWNFLDSRRCPGVANNHRFFIARYLLPCMNADSGCADNASFGFFEAVDASPSDDFDIFRREVVARNPEVFPGNPNPYDAINQNGVYRMHAGNHESLLFSLVAHKADPELTGILSVNDQSTPHLSQWPLADGDILKSAGDGLVTFISPNSLTSVTWDFRDAAHPKRTP